MGLFNKRKKEQDIQSLWNQAYQANPNLYAKPDDTLLTSFALTEDTDSLFAIVPEKQWTVKGQAVGEWLITMVSLTNPQGGIIGRMEYRQAIQRLEPFFLTKADNWALIRAMAHHELAGLFDNNK